MPYTWYVQLAINLTVQERKASHLEFNMRFQTPRVLLGALTIGVVLPACATETASVAGKPTSDCVFYSALYDWQLLDDTNLVVWVPGKDDAYHMVLTAPLPGLKSAYKLGYIDATKDGRLCGDGHDAITLTDNDGPQRSTIRSIEHLATDARSLLEAQYQLKLKPNSKRKAPPKVPDREIAQ
jgi:hypothetical protein